MVAGSAVQRTMVCEGPCSPCSNNHARAEALSVTLMSSIYLHGSRQSNQIRRTSEKDFGCGENGRFMWQMPK